MPLIEPKSTQTKQIRVRLPEQIIAEMKSYCEWAGIKKIDHFIEACATKIFEKDKGWIKYRKQQKKTRI